MKSRTPTGFETRVYEAIRTIPRGKVTTYGLLARHLGCGSAQAVGQALKRNPFAPATPCHRVVGTDMRLGGFHGKTDGPAIREKRQLLRAEGVPFLNDDAIDPACCHRFDA